LIPKAKFILDRTDTFFANPENLSVNTLHTRVNTGNREGSADEQGRTKCLNVVAMHLRAATRIQFVSDE
jgi:hypothetical protein